MATATTAEGASEMVDNEIAAGMVYVMFGSNYPIHVYHTLRVHLWCNTSLSGYAVTKKNGEKINLL